MHLRPAAPLLRLTAIVGGLALSACLADPGPTACAVDLDCPRDAPWCLAGACAAERADDTAADGAPPPSAAVPACAAMDDRRCRPVCDWLMGCISAECPRAVADAPELVEEVRESCASQCAVDRVVGDELCRLSADAGCTAAVDDMRRVLGFGVCR